MRIEKISDIDAYRNTAIGGTFSLKSGQTYEAGVTDLPNIAGFSVVSNVIIHILDDETGSALAKCGLVADETLKAGQTVVANRRFPFTKIVLSAGSGQVDLVKEK